MQLLKINKIIILFNSEKVPCHEGMPVKLIKLSAIATDSHLGKNINQDINLKLQILDLFSKDMRELK